MCNWKFQVLHLFKTINEIIIISIITKQITTIATSPVVRKKHNFLLQVVQAKYFCCATTIYQTPGGRGGVFFFCFALHKCIPRIQPLSSLPLLI